MMLAHSTTYKYKNNPISRMHHVSSSYIMALAISVNLMKRTFMPREILVGFPMTPAILSCSAGILPSRCSKLRHSVGVRNFSRTCWVLRPCLDVWNDLLSWYIWNSCLRNLQELLSTTSYPLWTHMSGSIRAFSEAFSQSSSKLVLFGIFPALSLHQPW